MAKENTGLHEIQIKPELGGAIVNLTLNGQRQCLTCAELTELMARIALYFTSQKGQPTGQKYAFEGTVGTADTLRAAPNKALFLYGDWNLRLMLACALDIAGIPREPVDEIPGNWRVMLSAGRVEINLIGVAPDEGT